MKISELLYERTRRLWDEAADNPFVTAMAEGTLDRQCFKAYMLQDYYYLKEYIGILEQIEKQAESVETAGFLKRAVRVTRCELETVHIPNMKQLGITDEEIQGGEKNSVCAEYLQYLKAAAQEGTVRGLAALLQCSWSYAYIAETVTVRYGDRLGSSAYAGWFRAYTSEEYTAANRDWIDILDREAEGIDNAEAEKLCRIFESCAHFENSFMNALI